jgi:hypothetical protein
MEVAIHLPDDIAAAVSWDDVPRHIVEQIALEGYQDGWLSEEQALRWVPKTPRNYPHRGCETCSQAATTAYRLWRDAAVGVYQ